eukprot:m.42186 g.42186  ORF g.42186 m.42186 type:complete len:112 (+) comp6237_c1_seq1:193-528(+)
MASSDEVGCAYAALVLADEGLEVSAEKLQAVLDAANVSVEGYWPGLFAKAVEGNNIKEMLSNIGAGGGGGGGAAPAAGGGGGGDAAPAAEEKKEEAKEESEEEDMDFGLFD